MTGRAPTGSWRGPLGARFGLVLSGVTTATEAEHGVTPAPSVTAVDLWSLVELELTAG